MWHDDRYIFLYYIAAVLLIALFVITPIPGSYTEESKVYLIILAASAVVILLLYILLNIKNWLKKTDNDTRRNGRYKFLYYTAIAMVLASTIVVTMPGIDRGKAELYYKILFMWGLAILLFYHFLNIKNRQKKTDEK